MPDLRLRGKVAVAAEDLREVRVFQQELSDSLAPEIRLGEIPLRAIRRRKKLAKRQLMNRRQHARVLAQRIELRLEHCQKLVEKLIVRSAQPNEFPIIPSRQDFTRVR